MTRAAILIGLILALCACDTRTEAQTTISQQVDTQSNLVDAKDLDLQTIVGMVKSNKVANAEQLEKAINSDNGINNVDVDKDGKIDYVAVREGRKGDAVALDLVAIPSGTRNQAEGVVVASITFRKDVQTNTVEVSGGYPTYVNGYGDYYYSYRQPGLTFGQAMFLYWAFSPRPAYYYHPYFSSYAYRPVYSHSVLTTRRTTYRSSVGSSAILSSRRPSTYTIPSAKVPSRFAPAPRSSGSSFTERSGQGRGFQNRTGAANKPSTWGTPSNSSSGWGSASGSHSTPSAPRSSSLGLSSGSKSSSWGSSHTTAPSAPRSSSWGSSSGSRSSSWGSSRSTTPSAPRSSSWGSSSGSRSSSWGSSSGSRSSSWGSSGRSSFGGGRRR
jgi:hypothetical protein